MTVQDKIDTISRYFTTKSVEIEHLIPNDVRCKPLTAYRWLIIISANPGLTETAYRDLYGTSAITINSAIRRLLVLGLIKQYQKPRWVTGIHAWKVEKVYKITYAGNKVLSNLV